MNNVEALLYSLVGILVFVVLAKIFVWPLKILLKLIFNAVLGVILLVIVNFVGSYFGFNIGINVVTSLIAGFAGIPGVVFLVLFKLIF